MSDILVHDLSARAARRLGRTHQVLALAPFPARRALEPWTPWRRTFVHPASDFGAGYGFGADSNLLRRLKMGLAEAGADKDAIASLRNKDAITRRGNITARPAALERFSAEVRERIESPERPRVLITKFSARALFRALADEERERTLRNTYEDTGDGDVTDLSVTVPAGAAATVRRTTSFPSPVRLTRVHLMWGIDTAVTAAIFRWSVTPPGLGYTLRGSGTSTDNPPPHARGPLEIALNVPVLAGSVQLELEIQTVDTTFITTQGYLAVAYTRLRRRTR